MSQLNTLKKQEISTFGTNEWKLKDWMLKNNNQMVIADHTHRPRFPDPGLLPYFNDGSCIHPESIIGLEIENLEIAMVK